MLRNIISHNREHDSFTTVKFGDNKLIKDIILDLVDEQDGTLLNVETLYDYISQLETPYLLGFPSIVTPKENDVITKNTIVRLTPFKPNNVFKGILKEAQWQVASDNTFKDIVYNKVVDSKQVPDNDLSSFTFPSLPIPSGYYWIRGRYRSYPHASPWTKPVLVYIPSGKVKVPVIKIVENELTPRLTVDNYSLTDEYKDKDSDSLKKVVWGINKVPSDTTADSTYVTKLLGVDYRPTYQVTKLATTADCNELTFPSPDDITNFNIRLDPNTTYLFTCVQIGNKYSTDIARAVYTTNNFKVKSPKFRIEQNGLNPNIFINEFETFSGYDTLDHFELTIVEEGENGISIVHKAELKELQYQVPDNICKPVTKYHFTLIAIGKKYGKSDPVTLVLTTPYIGILAPEVNIENRGLRPMITLSPFKSINIKETMRGTHWILLNHANVEGDKVIKEWVKEDTDTFLQIDKMYMEANTNYKIRVRYLGQKLNSPWTEKAFKTIDLVIYKPIVTANNQGLIISADVSDYIVLGDRDEPLQVLWNVWKVEDIPNSDPTLPSTEKIVEHIIEDRVQPWSNKMLVINRNDGVRKATKYKIVAKILGRNYNSPTSDPVYITTPNVYIRPPEVHIAGEPNNVPKYPEITCSKFETNVDTDKHISTRYKITNNNSNEVVLDVTTEEYLTKYNVVDPVLEVSTSYTLEVTYNGEFYGLSDPTTIVFITRELFVEVPDGDGLTEVIVGDDTYNESTKYYGTIPYEKLNDTRNYLGNWNAYTEYLFDSQVLYQGRLWKALDTSSIAIVGAHFNKNREPGKVETNGVTYWEEDDRYMLPTFSWVLRNIGFQAGVKDNNISGYTEGYTLKGNIVNKPSLSKYMLGTKILYIYDKIALDNISWNDLAIHDLVGKGRTIRIGETLFWVRLLTEKEYKELTRFTVEEDTNKVIPVELDKDQWLADITKSDMNALIGSADGVTIEHGASDRAKGLRLVLEYVNQYEEPYLFARKKYPTLQYDRYTDTGYFGTIDNHNYDWHTAIGLDTGVQINRDRSLLAFYSHGKRILIQRAPMSYNVSFDTIKKLNVVYGTTIKLSGYKGKRISDFTPGITYNIRIPKGGPTYINPGPEKDLSPDVFTAIKNTGRFSEWNELIYRVALQQPKSIDTNPMHGGYQIGSNWDTMDNINLGVFEHYSGNGSHDYVLTFANENEISSRGGTKLEAYYYVGMDITRNDHGVRLVLEDPEDFTKDIK